MHGDKCNICRPSFALDPIQQAESYAGHMCSLGGGVLGAQTDCRVFTLKTHAKTASSFTFQRCSDVLPSGFTQQAWAAHVATVVMAGGLAKRFLAAQGKLGWLRAAD